MRNTKQDYQEKKGTNYENRVDKIHNLYVQSGKAFCAGIKFSE